MNILRDLLSEIPQQALELSRRLYDELQALRSESGDSAYHSQIQKLNEMIWEYHESNRRALVVEDKQEASQTGKLLFQAKAEKSQLMLEHAQHQENIRRELDSLTKPVIEMFCERIDDEIKALPKQMVMHTLTTRKQYGEYGDRVFRTIEHNFFPIRKIGDLLLEGKSKIRSLNQNSISQILDYGEDLENQINQINLKELAKEEVSPDRYGDLKSFAEGGKQPSLPPEYHQTATKDYLDSQLAKAQHTLKDTEKWLRNQIFDRLRK
jgi:phage host-nuclease inhibitor protein Gam